MPAEVIVLEVDASSAIKAQAATAKGFEETEKRAKQATSAIAQTTEEASQQTIRIIDRTKNSIDRIAANAEKRASQIGKTAIERLESQRAFDLSRVAGDPRAIERVTAAYRTLFAEQRNATGFGAALRQALENPRGALDNLIGGLTGLPGILAAGAVAVGGLAVGIYKIVTGMTDWAEQLQNTAVATGLTRQEVQLFTAAAQAQGVSADILQTAMRGLSKTMEDTSPAAMRTREELNKMGVQLFETNGRAKATSQLFLSIADALSKIEDPIKRAAKAQEIFGRGGIEALKLFNGELAKTINEFERLGIAIDEKTLARLDEMDRKLDRSAAMWGAWAKRIKVAIVDLVNAIPATSPLGALLAGPLSSAAPGAGFTNPQDIAAAAGARSADIARGAAVVTAFQRRREQGIPGLQLQLGRLTEERQAALGRVGPGLGEAKALSATAEVEQLDQKIKSVQDRIKTIQEAPAKAEQARRQAEALDKALHGKRLEMIRESEKTALESAAKIAEENIALEGRIAQRRTEYQRETGLIQDQVRQRGFEQEMTAAQRTRDDQLRNLEGLQTKTVEQKVALEQQKLEIELKFLKEEERLNIESLQRIAEAEIALARIAGESAEDINNRLIVLREAAAAREKDARAKTAAEIEAIGKDSANRQAQTIQAEYDKSFDRIQSSFESTLDALLSRSRSWGQALFGIVEAMFLTPLKHAASTVFASIVTGRSAGIGGGLLGALPGLGVIGSPGAPGGTPGFAGPVGGIGALGQLGGLGGLTRGGISAAGIAPLALGGAALGGLGAFKLGQRGGVGGALAPGLGAASGLFGFGALTAMFPALAAAGPLGAIIGGGIGAAVGIIGLLRGKGEDKVREKIQAAYGVTIRDKQILQNVMAIAKQTYGGNIDAAIVSQPVRDIIELYNMTLGSGRSLGVSNVPRPVNAFQSGGQIFQSPSAYSVPRATASPTIVVQSLTLSVNGQSAADALEGRVAPAIASNSRIVVQAANKAQRSNVGRNRTSQTLLAPNLITS